MLIGKIAANAETWQDEDIDVFAPAFGDEYRWNTFDPDEIDWAHIKYMASRILAYAQEKKSLPNYVTFPSGDTSSEGYLPQLTMVVTKHDNQMNLRACMVVLTRTIKYFKENEGKTPASVSSWPASYLDAVSNCPKDDPLEHVRRAIRQGCQKIQLFKPYFTQESVDMAHEHGILCNVFYADDPEEACRYIDMGIDTILTNDYLQISNAVRRHLAEKAGE